MTDIKMSFQNSFGLHANAETFIKLNKVTGRAERVNLMTASTTHNVPGVDAQRAEQGFVAVGAPPLVPQTEGIVDVLQLPPHVPQSPADAGRKSDSSGFQSDGGLVNTANVTTPTTTTSYPFVTKSQTTSDTTRKSHNAVIWTEVISKVNRATRDVDRGKRSRSPVICGAALPILLLL